MIISSYKIIVFFFLILPTAFASQDKPIESDKETPVMFDDVVTQKKSKGAPWYSPDYSNQENTFGYNQKPFDVPLSMQERVSFWVDIYSKYNTDQGLLHDSHYVHLVYKSLDFTEIMKDEKLSLRQKRRARRRMVKAAKKEIHARLRKLHKIKNPEGLTGEDLRYWQLFSRVEGKNKFYQATKRNRLRFQLGQSDRFIQGIYFSGRYLEKMEKIFQEAGLPKELTRLPFVESSFNLSARSKVGASGIWQFMRYTGRRFMRINSAVDERNDPIRATESAARLLTMNYNMLGSWPLAVTGYNHGPAGVRRMLKKYNATKLEELVDERRWRFGFASANFYASFLAAILVEKRADEFFGLVFRDHPYEYDVIKLTRSLSPRLLVKWFDGNKERAKELNPHIRRTAWRGWFLLRKKDVIRIPKGKLLAVTEEIKKLPIQRTTLPEDRTYKIRRGDTISEIARRFRVSQRALKEVNGITNPRKIRFGQKIVIPERSN